MRARNCVASAAVALLMAGAANASELSFASWGGAWQDAQEKTAVRPFGAKNKVSIKSNTYNGGIAQLRTQVQTNNVTWDVVDMQLADAMRACDEGLLEKINPAVDLAPVGDMKAVDDFLPGAVSECLAGSITWSTLIVFNKDKFGATPPTKIADFFDLKKFPGKRALRKAPDGALEWALLADGVPADQVYKLLATNAGVERAFKKLDTIKSSVVWWETGAQPPQLLADGEVTMSSAYNGRIYSAIVSDKKPFDFLWDGQLTNIEGYAIVKGAKNLKEAKAFVRYATEPETLAALAPLTAYGPARKSSLRYVDAKVAPYLPTAPKNMAGALNVSPEFWADHADDLNQKFAAWLNRK
ncbi:ABC transporter substrate-binding protein [Azohydromonas australica]|uniref:ABC transporter substrate-binding protein n=1 Tax=Azohydromonas australica TaxID=364039 RepID=UPI00040C40B1|nr:ABC transporter substrate-binding protein [Azohydromonas australica]